jgi:hypothetical protein
MLGNAASREPSLTIANKIKLTMMGSAVNDWGLNRRQMSQAVVSRRIQFQTSEHITSLP